MMGYKVVTAKKREEKENDVRAWRDKLLGMNTARLYNLLLKEGFRDFAQESGISEFCVIDMDGYCKAPNMTGCLQRSGKWVVYETGEHGDKLDEVEYRQARRAFMDLAQRNGYKYSPILKRDKITVYKAMCNLQKIAEDLKESGEGKQAAQDAEYLRRAFLALNRRPSRRKRGMF